VARRAKAGLRRAFLKALARTGNVAWAARAAGIDKGTAYNLRHRDWGFGQAWRRAKLFADGCLGAAASGGGDSHFPHRRANLHAADRESDCPRDGGSPRARSNLVVRYNKREGTQLVRAGVGRWSNLVEARFTSALEATGNVRAAAAAAGVTTTALYNRRKRYPLLEAQWAAAREAGCRTVSLMLIDAAEAALDPDLDAAALGLPEVSVTEALAILRLHRFEEPGAPTHAGERSASRARRQAIEDMPLEAVRDEILRRLDAIRAHEARRPGEEAGAKGDAANGDTYVPVPEEGGTGTYMSPGEAG
jgi:hypothetical protein